MGDLEVGFGLRVAALLGFSLLAVSLDLRKPAHQRHRWREYGFLLTGTLLGSLIGAGVDYFTCSLSPEYFHYAKQIPRGLGFSEEVLWFGARVGASAGVIGSALLLVANRDAKQALSLVWLLKYPALGSVLFGVLFGGAQHTFEFFPPSEFEFLSSLEQSNYTWVRTIHLGVYVGAASGLLVALVQLRREGGFRPLQKVTVTEAVLVRASPEVVWDFTQDYNRRPQWDLLVSSAQVATDSSAPRVEVRGPGLRCTFVYKLYRRPQRTSLAMVDVVSPFIASGGGSWSYQETDDGVFWTQISDFSTLEALSLGKRALRTHQSSL